VIKYRILADKGDVPERYVVELSDDAAADAYCDAQTPFAGWVRVGASNDQWQHEDDPIKKPPASNDAEG